MQISLETGIELLEQGHVVAIPTDTIYGLAAILSDEAIFKIYSLKQRPKEQPLVIQVASLEEAEPLISETFDYRPMAKQSWPGPVTLVLEANTRKVPSSIRGGLSTVGIRIPNHPVALEILSAIGPLAVTSANLSGSRSATTAEEIEQAFGKEFPIVEGYCGSGVESTILAHDHTTWKVLR